MRLLRSYERMAMIPHSCDSCINPILPGDGYSGDVYVYEKPKELRVIKHHIFPPCNFDPEEVYQRSLEDLAQEFSKAA